MPHPDCSRENLLCHCVRTVSYTHLAGCHLCEHCTRPEGRPCRYPEGIGYTLESLGCDVSAAAEQLLGWPLLWSRKG